MLKPGGSLVHIGIGEHDALQLKRVFGRGQGFAQLGQSWLANACAAQRQSGFRIELAREFEYDEFYASPDELELFLQAVPIFEEFPLPGDLERLQRYADAARVGAEVRLPRHRFVTLATR